nr:unnamed protein product [Spirometra erinaceieuropaei]
MRAGCESDVDCLLELLATFFRPEVHFRQAQPSENSPTGLYRHVRGSRNEASEALSRPSFAHIQLSPGIEFTDMVTEHHRVGSPFDEDVSGLQPQKLLLITDKDTILSDVSCTT